MRHVLEILRSPDHRFYDPVRRQREILYERRWQYNSQTYLVRFWSLAPLPFRLDMLRAKGDTGRPGPPFSLCGGCAGATRPAPLLMLTWASTGLRSLLVFLGRVSCALGWVQPNIAIVASAAVYTVRVRAARHTGRSVSYQS